MDFLNSDWRSFRPERNGAPFPLLDETPERPGLWDLAADDEAARYWLALLRNNADYVRELAFEQERADSRPQVEQALAIFGCLLDELERGPARTELRTVHEITLIRDQLFRSFGLRDPYVSVKTGECEQCLEASRSAIARAWEWGASPTSEHLAAILTDLLTGNLFDLGSSVTQHAFRQGRLDYEAARARFRIATTHWIANQSKACLAMLCGPARPLDSAPEGRLVLLADNSGRDFLLGVLPAALFWARRWDVCVVVNSLPVSSDVAIDEARGIFAAIQSAPPGDVLARAMAAGRLRLVESGTGSPGIDLRGVGAEFRAAASTAAWIVIEGQGRAIETNWTTRFSRPVLRAAVAKDRLVARAIGVAPGSPVLRWDA